MLDVKQSIKYAAWKIMLSEYKLWPGKRDRCTHTHSMRDEHPDENTRTIQ